MSGPANTTRLPNAGWMLGQRRRRCPTFIQHWVNVSCLLVHSIPRIRKIIQDFLAKRNIRTFSFGDARCPNAVLMLGQSPKRVNRKTTLVWRSVFAKMAMVETASCTNRTWRRSCCLPTEMPAKWTSQARKLGKDTGPVPWQLAHHSPGIGPQLRPDQGETDPGSGHRLFTLAHSVTQPDHLVT